MSEKSKGGRKQNGILIVSIAFICGFVAGVGFTVFKMDSSTADVVHQTSQQQPQADPQQAQAILNLEAKVTSNPNDGQSWLQLGHLYYDSNQPEKAIGAYTKTLELQPGDANLYTDLGVMYRRVDKPETAIEMFNKAIEIDALHEFSRLNKGIVLLYDLNDPEGAFASWEEVLKINPNAQIANGNLLKDVIPQIKADLAKTQ